MVTAGAAGRSVEASMNNYIGPRFVAFGAPRVTATGKETWDETAQKSLWETSVRLTGEDFGGL